MVRFSDGSFTVEVRTGCDPIDSWLGLHEELTYLLGIVGQDTMPVEGLMHIAQLLAEMMPEPDTASLMAEK